MHVLRTLAALAVGATAGEFFVSPLAGLLSAPLGEHAGLAAAIILPLAVAGAGAIGWALTAAPKQGRDARGRFV